MRHTADTRSQGGKLKDLSIYQAPSFECSAFKPVTQSEDK